jgi:hypothetical protein
MTVRRRLCRALDCPRHVDRHVLFCNVHWPQLTPNYQRPIANNREAPTNATPTVAGKVLSGVTDAVTFLARKEGKKAAVTLAIKTQAVVPGQGGIGGDRASGSGGTGRFTSKL